MKRKNNNPKKESYIVFTILPMVNGISCNAKLFEVDKLSDLMWSLTNRTVGFFSVVKYKREIELSSFDNSTLFYREIFNSYDAKEQFTVIRNCCIVTVFSDDFECFERHLVVHAESVRDLDINID